MSARWQSQIFKKPLVDDKTFSPRKTTYPETHHVNEGHDSFINTPSNTVSVHVVLVTISALTGVFKSQKPKLLYSRYFGFYIPDMLWNCYE